MSIPSIKRGCTDKHGHGSKEHGRVSGGDTASSPISTAHTVSNIHLQGKQDADLLGHPFCFQSGTMGIRIITLSDLYTVYVTDKLKTAKIFEIINTARRRWLRRLYRLQGPNCNKANYVVPSTSRQSGRLRYKEQC